MFFYKKNSTSKPHIESKSTEPLPSKLKRTKTKRAKAKRAESTRFNTFFQILFDLSQLQTQHITSHHYIQQLLSVMQMSYIYPRCLFDFLIFKFNANDQKVDFLNFINELTPPTSSITNEPICTILINTNDDHNGYIHGFLGKLQVLYDKYCLMKNGYQVKVKIISCYDTNLLNALKESSVIIFRGHGHTTADPLLDFIQNFDIQDENIQNALKKLKKTVVFESCSTSQYFQDEIDRCSLHSKMQQCQIHSVFAPEKDTTASKLRFDPDRQLQSVEYIPYLGLGFPNILKGRTMTLIQPRCEPIHSDNLKSNLELDSKLKPCPEQNTNTMNQKQNNSSPLSNQ